MPAQLRAMLNGRKRKQKIRNLTPVSSRTLCPHVAIFNWDHLLLYEFPLSNNKTEDTKTMLTWVTETAELREVDEIQTKPIRKVLLDWLLKAFEAHLGESESTHGEPCDWD
ncbi:hypothetical protein OPT61_g6039 [Boeremia exigua]|uniref:Uncharacterized protein n=1 Tax=Boeremia exigua TaxID=749465 RepID=A0ACC2I894_9PLEO|nr:hypothetical protein OPT61_g6039 [Boeremia exigua]